MPGNMTKEEKKKWEESQQFMKENRESALKDCDVPVSCEVCYTCIGYASKDIYFEDFQIICNGCAQVD